MQFYQQLGNLVGTAEARHLAAQLAAWHDAMVRHVRAAGVARTAGCEKGCPHDEAATLWAAALTTFGDRATTLTFLRRHGAVGLRWPGFDVGVPKAHA